MASTSPPTTAPEGRASSPIITSPAAVASSSLWWVLPGAAQGATTVLLGHPFDTAKTRLQADKDLKLQTRSSVKVMRQMARQEGVLSLYRGVTPPLAIMGCKRGLQFALWDHLKRRKATEANTRNNAATTAVDSQSNNRIGGGGGLSSSTAYAASISSAFTSAGSAVANNNFLSGAVSGAFGTIIGCPMHVIKIQTQNVVHLATPPSSSSTAAINSTSSSAASASAARSSSSSLLVERGGGQGWNAFYCTKAILREDGVRGLYRGFKFHVLKDTIFAGTYLGTYEKIRVELSDPASPYYQYANAATFGGLLSAVWGIGGGGGGAASASTPSDRSSASAPALVGHNNNDNHGSSSRRRNAAQQEPLYTDTAMLTANVPGAVGTLAMAREDKLEILKPNTSATAATTSPPSSAMTRTATHSSKTATATVIGGSSSSSSNLTVFTAGVLASCFTWVVLYPLDTLKTTVQARNAVSFASFVRLMAQNPFAVYRGFSAALVRAGPVSGVAMVMYESTKRWVHDSSSSSRAVKV